MPTVIPAKGTLLEVKLASTFVTVGGLLQITWPNPSVEKIDTTNLNTEGNYKTSRPGFADPGECTCQVQFDPGDATHAALRASAASGTVYDWRVSAPTTPLRKGDAFSGYVQECGPESQGADANLEASITIALSGAIVPYTEEETP